MPFKSQAQRRFMYAKHPELAKEFEDKTPKNAKLPERKKSVAAQVTDKLRKMRKGGK